MKKRKFFRLLWAVFVAMMLLPLGAAARMQDEIEESVPYGIFDEVTGTVTFYFGEPTKDAVLVKEEREDYKPLVADVVENYLDEVKKVVFDKSFHIFKPTTMAHWFRACKYAIEGLENINTEDVTDMSQMFIWYYVDKSVYSILDLSSWDTRKVTNMEQMFYSCAPVQIIYVGDKWSTESVTNGKDMFKSMPILVGGQGTTLHDIENLVRQETDDNKYVQYARIDEGPDAPGLFARKGENINAKFEVYADKKEFVLGESLNGHIGVDITNYNLTMIRAWLEVLAPNNDLKPVVSGFDNTKLGKQTITINCYNTTTTLEVNVVEPEPYAVFTPDNNTLTLYYDGQRSKFDPNNTFDVPNYSDDDETTYWLSPIGDINTVVFHSSFAAYRPTSTARWFDGCSKLREIEGLEYLNTEDVINMNRMFVGCSLTALDVSHFNTAKVTNMYEMFSNCSALTNLDVSNFNTSNVTNMGAMFWDCGIESLDLSSFNTMSVEEMSSMIGFCQNLKNIYVSYDFVTPYERAYIFQICDNLIGGEGTKWSNDYVVGYTYAHIDGGPDYPGLFTKSPKETRTPVSIEIATPPVQLVYAKDEALNLDEKARLTVKFDDGSEIHPWIANSKVTGYDPTVIGEQTVTVEYLGLTTTFEVRVISNGVIVEPDDTNTETVADLYDNTLTTLVETETEVDKVVVHREFKENSASTIVLPLDKKVADAAHGVTNMDGYEFYEFAGVAKNDKGKWEATYKQVETIEANKPYIVVNKEGNDLVFDNGNEQIDLKPVGKDETTITEGTDGTSAEGWEFVGTYEKKVWDADSPNEFGFAANAEGDDIEPGDFVRIGEGASIKPMRAYLRYTKDDNPFSKAGEQLPDKIGVVLIPLGSVVNPDDPNNDPNNGDIETPVSEIVPATNNDAKVWSYNKTIVIEAAPSTAYQVIDLGGRTLKNGVTNSSREEIVLGSKTDGMVIVRIDGKSFKIKY